MEREGSSILLAMVVEQVEEANEKRIQGKCMLRFGLDIHTEQELSESQDTIDVDIFEGANEKSSEGMPNKKAMSNGRISRRMVRNREEEEPTEIIEIDYRVHIEVPLSGYKLLVKQKMK